MFCEHSYERVYQSRGGFNPEMFDRFFESLRLREYQHPNAFLMEFFKVFCDKLSPLMLRMLNHSMKISRLPTALYKANISLIPKPGRDLNLVYSYCPISLLPIMTKILGKTLAKRFKEQICSTVHPDQTGFMPGRHIFFNLRYLFNVLCIEHTEEVAVISLRAQCAFN